MTTTRPAVSIGMPIYNAEEHLDLSIQAVLSQTYTDFELILCDNASTDGTQEICRRYVAQDKRVWYHRNQENVGGPLNFTKTFELSRGRFFKWATSDDLSAPTLVERCLEVIESRPDVALAFGKTEIIDEVGTTIGPYDDKLDLPQARPSERLRALLASVGLCNAHYGVMRSDDLKRTRLLRDFFASDCILLAELSLLGKFQQVPEVLFYRRFHRGASSWDRHDVEKQVEFWNPRWRGKKVYPRWRHHHELCTAILRAPMALREKLACLAFLLRRMAWDRRALGGELLAPLRRSPAPAL